MSVRSKYIVHWTGKKLPQSDDMPADYIRHLKSFLEVGIWMTNPQEHLIGGRLTERTVDGKTVKALEEEDPNADPSVVSLKKIDIHYSYGAHMTCFTETRLSQSRDHAEVYGCMGLGFLREFALERYGGPVHYVRNRHKELLAMNAHAIHQFLVDEEREGNENVVKRDMIPAMTYMISYMKGMSRFSEKREESMSFLEEFEWRIVHSDIAQNEGKIKDIRSDPKREKYAIPFTADDIQILIVPDDEVLRLVWADAFIKPWLQDTKHPPAVLTLDQCAEL